MGWVVLALIVGAVMILLAKWNRTCAEDATTGVAAAGVPDIGDTGSADGGCDGGGDGCGGDGGE